jgi:ATP-dependent DNA ligase
MTLHLPVPMLASALREPLTGARFDARFGPEWALEEKHKGHRCIIRVGRSAVVGYSRPQHGHQGVPLTRPLPASLVQTMRHLPTGDYDGELVATTGRDWDVKRTGAALVFVAFDMLMVAGYDTTPLLYDLRRGTLLEALRRLPPDQTDVTTVVSEPPTWAAVQAIWARQGEGAVLKRRASLYERGRRSPDWLKVKLRLARTLTITGFKEGESGPYSAIRLVDAEGRPASVKTPGHAMLRAMAAHPMAYVGRALVISYQEITPDGKYVQACFDHFAGPGEVDGGHPPARTRR